MARGLCALRTPQAERELGLRGAIDSLFEMLPEGVISCPAPTPRLAYGITALATLTAQLRTPVRRTAEREMASTPSPEQAPRLAQQLHTLFVGFTMIGCTELEAWHGIQRVAQDSLLPLHRRVFDVLRLYTGEAVSKPEIVSAIGRHTCSRTIQRILENFEVLQIAVDTDRRETRSQWILTDDTAVLCRTAFCEGLPEPTPEELASVPGFASGGFWDPETAEVGTATGMAIATAEGCITPPEDGGGGGGGGDLPLRQPPLITSAPDRARDDQPEASFAFDDRQPV